MTLRSCILAACFVLLLSCGAAFAAVTLEPRVQDRADCEKDCVAQCSNAPMKKFLCERRCKSECKKDIPSATDKKGRR